MLNHSFSLTPFNINIFQDGYTREFDYIIFHVEHSFLAITTMEKLLQDLEQENQAMISIPRLKQVQMPPPSSLASLELLKNYGSKFNKQKNKSNVETCVSPQKLSTEDIIRLAGTKYIQNSSEWHDNNLYIPYGTVLGSLLSEEENEQVELAQFVLAAAERVGCQQFERANMLLSHFHLMNESGNIGSTVQRLLFHFSQALQERINRETGRGKMKLHRSNERNKETELIDKMELDTNIVVKCHQKIPFNQVMQFAGVQAIVEHVASQTKIHLIHLNIGCGVMGTCFMQALVDRKEKPVEILKITAIGFSNKAKLEEIGKSLTSFAESLNLPFLYNIVFVEDAMEIKLDQFEIEYDEAVAIYSPCLLRTMVSNSDGLENLMKVIRKMKPFIMIVLELEANHNSPLFANRFVEALFFYSAFFDCVDTCIKEDYECRVIMEAILSEGIRNIVGLEDEERKVRNVKIDVWRRFFARYRMVETGFSESSIYQANLVAKKFDCGKFCTIDKNGNCLIIGWKGTPLHSISAWKFL